MHILNFLVNEYRTFQAMKYYHMLMESFEDHFLLFYFSNIGYILITQYKNII